MTQLRSFVYQRLYKAAEEISEEAEKFTASALLKANGQRLKQERDSEPHLTTSALKREEESNLIKSEFQTDLGIKDEQEEHRQEGKSSARSQADLRVCPMCGKGFRYIPPMVKHMKKHKKIDDPTKKLIDELQSFYIRKICNVCGKKFANTWGLILHSKKCN